MAETEKKKSEKISRRIAGGNLWIKEKTDHEGKKNIFYSGSIDFGILGISNIMIFKRTPREGEKENMPDYDICISNGNNNLSSIGGLWKRTYDRGDGKEIPYLSGVLSAGVHGEYSAAVFDIDENKKKSDKSPDKVVHISIQRNKKDKTASSEENTYNEQADTISEEDVPF